MQRGLTRAMIAAFASLEPAVGAEAQGQPETQFESAPGAPAPPSLGDLGFPAAQTQGNAQQQARLDKRSHDARTDPPPQALAWIHGPGMILTPMLGAMAFDQKSRERKFMASPAPTARSRL
jgi:hypothetical protein